MANETRHLLSYDEDVADDNHSNHISVYNSRMVTSHDTDHDVQSALKVINEQSDLLVELRRELSSEQDNNKELTRQVDVLHDELEKVNKNYKLEVDEMNKEINKLKTTFEAQNESQAAIADELRFQIQSLRNKLDNSNKSHCVENGDALLLTSSKYSRSPSVTPVHTTESSKIMKRKNSADSSCSTNSNPYLMSPPCITHRGEITWRINAFSKKLKRIVSGSYDDPTRSEAFTTGACGYRLSGWVYLNGRGKGQDRCLSVYIRVMAGEYDPILVWPIKPCYTFYLLSQDEDSSKRYDLVRIRDLSIKHSGIYRPLKDDKTIIVGFDDFILHEDIEKKNYLLDDSLFLKFVVEIPPP